MLAMKIGCNLCTSITQLLQFWKHCCYRFAGAGVLYDKLHVINKWIDLLKQTELYFTSYLTAAGDSPLLSTLTFQKVQMKQSTAAFAKHLWGSSRRLFWLPLGLINHSWCRAELIPAAIWSKTSDQNGKQQFHQRCRRCHHNWPHNCGLHAALWLWLKFQTVN